MNDNPHGKFHIVKGPIRRDGSMSDAERALLADNDALHDVIDYLVGEMAELDHEDANWPPIRTSGSNLTSFTVKENV